MHRISNHAQTTAWLRSQLQPEDGKLHILFDQKKVCELEAVDFFDAWFDFFVPASELLILHASSDVMVMYHHEDVLEAGKRIKEGELASSSHRTTDANFDHAIEKWIAWQTAPWGKLRYRGAAHNLKNHLPKPSATILDLGGGNGGDAIWLAKLGHHVTIVDFSAEMLAQGKAVMTNTELENRVNFIQSSVADLPDFLSDQQFDVVVCHNLIQYLESPADMLATVFERLKPNGIFSLIITNPHAEVLGSALRNLDMGTALAQVGKKKHYVNSFETEISRYDETELWEMITEAGFENINQYGIRMICDFIADNEIKEDPIFYAEMEALEFKLSSLKPFKSMARFYHFVASKPTK